MALDGVSKIADYIGETIREQDHIDANLSPDDFEFVNTIEEQENIITEGLVIGYKWIFEEDSFIIDHPIQGEIDSATLKIDGGYRNSTDVYFDLTYPILWDEGFKEKLFEQVI